jgi:indole-3-glycerol phosphate synthase
MRFADALARPGLQAIAEFKRASPSAGSIRPGADVRRYAHAYATAGAAAMSVLVDRRFDGSLDDLIAAREATDLPLLAKGFFTREQELDELHEAGADAVLLLLRDLDDEQAAALQAHARRLGLDALVEAHDADELERAGQLGADPIGLNARDLGTFRVDRRVQLGLVARAPRDRVVIAESGIGSRAQAAAAELAGADAVLVGTALMRADDPAAALRSLLARPLVKVCGLTRDEDVAVAVEAGADLCGFILVEASPRRADRVLEVPDEVLAVGVYVGKAGGEGDLQQVYEPEEGRVRGRDAILQRDGEEVARVIDLPWQEGDPSHLERARAVEGRVMLAGGLDPENVREAIEAVRPWAVDASSSLEREPGIKDHDRVREFVAAAR